MLANIVNIYIDIYGNKREKRNAFPFSFNGTSHWNICSETRRLQTENFMVRVKVKVRVRLELRSELGL